MARNATGFDVSAVRADFPLLTGAGRNIASLDNAATGHKPRAVLDAVRAFYEEANANIHRGVHRLSGEATRRYETARDRIAAYLHAADRSEIVFTRGTTESINLVAQSFLRPRVKPGDEILITHMEHHSNIVPWRLVAEQAGAVVRVAPVDDRGVLDVDAWRALFSDRTRIAAFLHTSNAIGTINPAAELVAIARERGVPVLVDGAQAVPHQRIDVSALDADFFAFSGHKAFGPTGIGVLHARREHLEAMPPYQGGGEMIKSVRQDEIVWNDVPYKFEAGTPNIAGAIGLAAAIDYIDALDFDATGRHERALLDAATARLSAMDGLRIIGTAPGKAAVVSFVMDGIHPHDLGTILDENGVAVRTGHHCAQPLLERFGLVATARASFAFYNTLEEVDALVAGLEAARRLFS